MKLVDSDTPVFPFRSGPNGWWGFIDGTGKVLISAESSHIRERLFDFYGGLAAMEFDDGTSWMIDTNGSKQFAIYPKYEGWNYVLRDGLMPNRDRSSGKWGYVDYGGQWRLAPTFDFAFPFSQERAVVQMGKLRGVITAKGKWVTTPSLSWAIGYQDGLLAVARGRRFSYLDRRGRPVFGRDFENASQFVNGLAAIREANRWGVIDRRGRIVAPFQYEAIWLSHDGSMMVKQNNLWGIVDRDGHMTCRPAFTSVEPFSCGCALIHQGPDGSNYFAGIDGGKLFGTSYSRVEHFALDRAPVQWEAGGESAWIDRNGKAVFRWMEILPGILQEQMGKSPPLTDK